MPEIRYLKHIEIDKQKWDECLMAANPSMIYAMSWYLDAMTDQKWDALVYGDYEAIFPLPWRRKFGIYYIYQPFFSQQLGLFSSTLNTPSIEDFIRTIPRKFKKIHLQVNSGNSLKNPQSVRKNYILNLHKTYEEIEKGFNRDARQNIRKYKNSGVEFKETQNYELALELHQNTWGQLDSKVGIADYERFKKTCQNAQKAGRLLCVEAHLNHEIIGAGIFMLGVGRIHYLVSGPTEMGRKLSIMHGIINHTIQHFANTPNYLDFEGSEIPEVAVFYEKWGSLPETYQTLYRRRL